MPTYSQPLHSWIHILKRILNKVKIPDGSTPSSQSEVRVAALLPGDRADWPPSPAADRTLRLSRRVQTLTISDLSHSLEIDFPPVD